MSDKPPPAPSRGPFRPPESLTGSRTWALQRVGLGMHGSKPLGTDLGGHRCLGAADWVGCAPEEHPLPLGLDCSV